MSRSTARPHPKDPHSVHKYSLLDQSSHPPELLELVDMKISSTVVKYLTSIIIRIVEQNLSLPKPRGLFRLNEQATGEFVEFVERVLIRAEVSMPTLLVTMVYLERPDFVLPSKDWALERVFLGALIVASKYLNDINMKNIHWAICTGKFGRRDIGRIEREYLSVLNFRLRVSEEDILGHYRGVVLGAFTIAQPLHQFEFSSILLSSTSRSHLPSPEHGVRKKRRQPRPSVDVSKPSNGHGQSSLAYSAHPIPGVSGVRRSMRLRVRSVPGQE